VKVLSRPLAHHLERFVKELALSEVEGATMSSLTSPSHEDQSTASHNFFGRNVRDPVAFREKKSSLSVVLIATLIPEVTVLNYEKVGNKPIRFLVALRYLLY
jgi:hypothetical protein